MNRTNLFTVGIVVLAVFGLVSLSVFAGSLSPSASPASTFYTLSQIFNPLASTSYDSSGFSADQNGSLIEMLKYTNNNLNWLGVAGNTTYTSKAIQVGSTATVSYSRFGTDTTGHGLSAASDLLISGMAEINGRAFFDSTASVSDIFEITKNGTSANLLKLTDSSVSVRGTVGLTVNDGDFQIRVASSALTFATEYPALMIASQSGGTSIGAPKRPQVRGVISGSGSPNYLDEIRDVYVSGRYAYAVTGGSDDSLVVIDISNPASPTFEGKISGAGSPNYLNNPFDIVVVGKYAYVAVSDDDALTIIDISNPSTPLFVGKYQDATLLNDPLSLNVVGRYAYVATRAGNGLTIVDVGNPTTPRFVGRISGSGNFLSSSRGVHVIGNYAYITAQGSNALTIVDISNPTTPRLVGKISGSGSPYFLSGPRNLYVSGKHAYIAASDQNSFTIVDISNPASPSFRGKLSGSGSPNYLNGVRGVYVAGNYAYLTSYDDDSFVIIDVSNPQSPSLVKAITGTSSPNYLNGARSVSVSGRYAYVASELDDALVVMDLGGFDTPTLFAGGISASTLEIHDSVDIGGDLFVRGGLGVGGGGLLVNGRLDVSIASLSNTAASSSAESLFRITHAKGYLSGDALQVSIAASTSPSYFTGDFARFTLAGNDRVIIESSGAILASGAAQFGSAGAPASVAYSRFGTSATSHSNYIASVNDLLISGDLEVNASAAFDSFAMFATTTTFKGQLIVSDTTLSDANMASISTTVNSGNVFKIYAPSLNTGDVFDVTVPVSTSFAGNIFEAKNTLGAVMFRVKSGGEVAARQAIFSHGVTSTCTGVDTPLAGCIDYAEDMPASDDTLQAGELVAVDGDEEGEFQVVRSQQSYDKGLIGIISTNPAIVIGDSVRQGRLASEQVTGQVPVALAGRVPVKVSYENGDIKKGDYLTSSSEPGKAMKAVQNGRVVGIALASAKQSRGDTSVMVFINPHYAGGELDAQGMLANFDSTPILSDNQQSLIASILDYFEDTLVKVKKLVAGTVEVEEGLILHDKTTGEPYCVTIDNGQLQAVPGNCFDEIVATPESTPTPSDSPLPVGESAEGDSEPTPEPTPEEVPEETPEEIIEVTEPPVIESTE